jgi:hypothetical protein
MRKPASMLFGAILSTGLLAGCGDLTTPASEGPHAEHPGFSRSAGVEKVVYAYVEVKKNGRTKLYRVKINKGRRSIEFQTVAEEGMSTTSSVDPTCDDPTMPGCESDPENPDAGTGGSTGTGILTGELEIDGTVTDTIETDQPWDPSYSNAGWDGTQFHCPSRVDDVHFNWKNHYFQTQGVSYYLGRVPSRVAGVVKGRYLLPQGPWLSTDGRARIWSGTVEANCYFVYTTVYGILLIEAGGIATYKFSGDYEEIGSDANFAANDGGQYGGTVYHSLDALQSGDPQAFAVVKAWLDTGACTDGWVIIIDGERVC